MYVTGPMPTRFDRGRHGPFSGCFTGPGTPMLPDAGVAKISSWAWCLSDCVLVAFDPTFVEALMSPPPLQPGVLQEMQRRERLGARREQQRAQRIGRRVPDELRG